MRSYDVDGRSTSAMEKEYAINSSAGASTTSSGTTTSTSASTIVELT